MVSSRSEFVSGFGFALMGGWSGGRRRGAFHVVQHRSSIQVEGRGRLTWRLSNELPVRPHGVLELTADGRKSLDLTYRGERRFVIERFIHQTVVEGCDKAVRHGFARGYVMPLDTSLIGLCQNGVAGELAVGIADSHSRSTAFFDQTIQFPSNTLAR